MSHRERVRLYIFCGLRIISLSWGQFQAYYWGPRDNFLSKPSSQEAVPFPLAFPKTSNMTLWGWPSKYCFGYLTSRWYTNFFINRPCVSAYQIGWWLYLSGCFSQSRFSPKFTQSSSSPSHLCSYIIYDEDAIFLLGLQGGFEPIVWRCCPEHRCPPSPS